MTNALTVQNPKNIRRNRKGFTLIELIVVIAILAILAAIAIPAFTNIQDTSRVKADAATAAEICSAARVQEADTGTAIVAGDPATVISADYIKVTKPQNGPSFAISGGGTSKYVVKWTPATGKYAGKQQTVTEGEAFKLS
ncbi:MAG: prepilin-type N-terminal cleavage/methylation domain-containing protein [Clostridiaceae bacterium]|nr:prepilin-type N-terminal cleavage/methylation domain-containing protein [Clostridiaceae bacterium]